MSNVKPQQPQPNMPTTATIAHLAEASAWYRHAESIVQQRLNNYLVLATLLYAGMITLAAVDKSHVDEFRWPAILLLAIFGLALSLLYAALGARWGKFILMHRHAIADIEAQMPRSEPRIVASLVKLQNGEQVGQATEPHLQLIRLERMMRSTSLLWIVPSTMSLLFAAALCWAAWKIAA